MRLTKNLTRTKNLNPVLKRVTQKQYKTNKQTNKQTKKTKKEICAIFAYFSFNLYIMNAQIKRVSLELSVMIIQLSNNFENCR